MPCLPPRLRATGQITHSASGRRCAAATRSGCRESVRRTDSRIWRVAVVGCGIGRAHIAGYKSQPDKFQVLALCDIDEKGLASAGDEFSIARRTKSVDDLLRMEDVDIVDLCTPPALHVPQTLAALAAGKEVVCEKPLAGSLAEVDRTI